MTDRAPFAKLNIAEDGCVYGMTIAGEIVSCGNGRWKTTDAYSTVYAINRFFERRVGLAVKKAVKRFGKRAAAEAFKIVRGAAYPGLATEVEEAILALPLKAEDKNGC